MHTIQLMVEDSTYSHVMFLLKSLNTKGIEIIEDKKISSLSNTKESMKKLFEQKNITVFESIDNPLAWQKEQRKDW